MHFPSICSIATLSSAAFACQHHPGKRNATGNATTLLDDAIQALGGETTLRALQGVEYFAPSVYRTQTLMQNYDLFKSDQYVSIQGMQNVSFSFANNILRQRIDRSFIPSPYWLWGTGSLDPVEYSLVVQEGDDGFACYVQGNNEIFLPGSYIAGYTDAQLAEYLVARARMLSPKLIGQINEDQNFTETTVTLRDGVRLPAVIDRTLNLTMIFDPKTHLPYIIRSYEQHPIFGLCSFDIQLTNYTTVAGLRFPQRIQSIYSNPQGSDAVLEDFLVESINVNPTFPSDHFNGLPQNLSSSPKVAPDAAPQNEFAHANIGEAWSNMIYDIYEGPLGNLTATHPVPDLLHVWNVQFANTGYAQMVVEFADGVVVADAPPSQTDAVIQWVQETLGKPVKYFWPTHHHRDHTGGVRSFVEIGAKIITPDIAVPYWSSVPNASLVTFNDTHPFVVRDNVTQMWFLWEEESAHSADWTYAMATAACPSADSGVAVFNADVWDIGTDAIEFDIGFARQWLDQSVQNGLAKNTTVVPAHGEPTALIDLLDITGYAYPSFDSLQWRAGSLDCTN